MSDYLAVGNIDVSNTWQQRNKFRDKALSYTQHVNGIMDYG
jgi:hypothetical protein